MDTAPQKVKILKVLRTLQNVRKTTSETILKMIVYLITALGEKNDFLKS